MYIITLKDFPSGIFSVFDDTKNRIIPLFEHQDDATRYLLQLEQSDSSPELEVLGIDPEIIVNACRNHGQKYSIISSDDLIIPPDDLYN